jgi:hypothetical protein
MVMPPLQTSAVNPLVRLAMRPGFTSGNVEVLLVYGALGLLFLVLVVFLQQTAGDTAQEAGAATIPTTVLLLLLARPFGTSADRGGPRVFMGTGPLVSAAGGALDIDGFRMALAAAAALLALGGAIGVWCIPNHRRQVAASRCAAGQLASAPSPIGEVPAVGPDPLRGRWPVGCPHRSRP